MKKENNISKPAIFIDRDGVINDDKSYVFKKEDLNILDGVGEALALLKGKGYLLIVVTNQSGVARGYFTLEDVQSFHHEIQSQLKHDYDLQIDGFMICPHHKKGKIHEFTLDCECRKPKTKMISDSLEKWDIDLSNSFMIGDKKSDVQLAKNVKIPGIQISNGMYEEHEDADYYAKDLLEAVKWILKEK